MGEMVVSANPNDELTALGLGSCIGLAIVDRTAGVAGLAHIVLPESGSDASVPGKFADTAVPELLDRLRKAGAVDRRMEAAIAGGARMFETSGGMDIGARNAEAVREALAAARVTLRAAEIGGNQGRTVRVAVGAGVVTVRIAGQQPTTLLEPRHVARTSGSAAPAPASRAAAAAPRTLPTSNSIRGPRAAAAFAGGLR